MTTTFGPGYSRPVAYNAAAASIPGVTAVPSGTFAPGTKVQVGGHRVVIEKYLSEGGFAHVYVVRLPKPVKGEDTAVLKRVAVPDKETLASMRTEVETMQKLKGHRHIVTYIDSHASQLKGGGYEVFLLMEYCNGGGLIDFMNTRLQNRLTEPEILKIFSDVAQGVACMHYLKPPLLHRDLKVENVLISSSGSSKLYKLCDFGSAAPPRPAATSAHEGRLIEEDIQKHTTLQYRSPEMIDVYRRHPIDEKSDIWALGVLLYKLCYYKTPFEEQGQMAILNASFKYPGYPSFSDRVKKLIASMLRENPQHRPNIYQVIRESEARRNQHLPSGKPDIASPPALGAYRAPVVQETPEIPDIVPMRRGRPSKNEPTTNNSRPSPSPLRSTANDPFTALDTPQQASQSQVSIEEISNRFPPLDQFSLLHDSGSRFAFDPQAKISSSAPSDISQRVTNALADEAFGHSAPKYKTQEAPALESEAKRSETGAIDSSREFTNTISTSKVDSPKPSMVSTGTMTSPLPPDSSAPTTHNTPQPIFRFPPSHAHRSSSQPRASDGSLMAGTQSQPSTTRTRPGLLEHRSKSQVDSLDVPRSPASSRPSLEGQRPSAFELDTSINRSKSATFRTRPVSEQLNPRLGIVGHSRKPSAEPASAAEQRPKFDTLEKLPRAVVGGSDSEELEKIDSNVDFLKAMEEEEPSRRKEKRSSSGSKHAKRASMPSISLSGTKNLLTGRFGEAFRRFETNSNGAGARSPSSSPDRGLRELTPIAGSEATDGRSDDGQGLEETEEVPPEVRRELERRRLSQEEKRVADAAAAYRQRIVQRGTGSRGPPASGPANNRATSIQNKVKSLLDESGRSSPTSNVKGYSRFNQSPEGHQSSLSGSKPSSPSSNRPLPAGTPSSIEASHAVANPVSTLKDPQSASRFTNVTVSLPERPSTRPNAPPKPQALRTGAREEQRPTSPAKPPSLARKVFSQPPGELVPPVDDDDWEARFSKKYPSLAGMEMVETEIDKSTPAGLRVNDA
ncbi:MAG: hypothetical protein Q9191_003838 [Dirinaria sp. TL-2023a]